MKRIAFWGLFAVTMGVYGAMLAWSLPTVAAAAGGLTPFDMRPGGYGIAEAREFLLALSPAGLEFYRNVQQRLDLLYPALIGLTLFFAVYGLLPKAWAAMRFTVAAPVLLIAVFDYYENHAIATMLELGPDGLIPEVVGYANIATLLKSGATTVAMTAVLGLLGWHAVRGVMGLARRRRVVV